MFESQTHKPAPSSLAAQLDFSLSFSGGSAGHGMFQIHFHNPATDHSAPPTCGRAPYPAAVTAAILAAAAAASVGAAAADAALASSSSGMGAEFRLSIVPTSGYFLT